MNFKNSKSILTGLILLAYTGLFLPIEVSNVTIVLLLFFCLIRAPIRKILIALRKNTFTKLMALIYVLQVIGLLYTSNDQMGLFFLEKKASLLLIPLFVLPALQLDPTDMPSLFKRIGYITLLSSVVLLLLATIKRVFLNDPLAFYFEEVTSIHYVYYSLYFACGSLFLIDSVFDSLSRNRWVLIAILFLYSIGFLVLIASKTGILAFALASIYLLYRKVPGKKTFALMFALIITAAAGFLYFNKTTRERFVGLDKHLYVLKLDTLRGTDVYINDLNMRLLFWKIATVNAYQDHLVLTGVGTGDAQDYIDGLYKLPKYELFGYIGWDSHNQWVFTFIQLGIFGVLALGVLYALYFRESLRANDMKFVLFLMITLAFSLSESILESNKGIVFFSLIFTLLSLPYQRAGAEPESIIEGLSS